MNSLSLKVSLKRVLILLVLLNANVTLNQPCEENWVAT